MRLGQHFWSPDPELYESGVYRVGTTRLSAVIDTVRRGFERQKLALLRRSLPPLASLLGAGAGQGRFVAAARAAGYDAGGLEPSDRGVEVAAARGIALQKTTLDDASVEPGSVGVTLWHVLEHLDSPGSALDLVATWLRPGGVLLVGVPNIDSLQARIGGARWLHHDPPRPRHHFTPAGLRTLLGAHGFIVEREHHVLLEHNPFGMWQAWLDQATTAPSYTYNLVKRNAALRPRDVAATILIGTLGPVAAVVEVAAGLARRGGTVALVARRADGSAEP
jgi:2-polyprenyl-3-methyl-5-hydroxy-6-metoxy-1,4-benzoquinol methylase